MAKSLTWRQRLFITALLSDPKASPTNAAKAAGYKNPEAAVKFLYNNHVVRYMIESKTKADAISASECLARISEVAQFDPGEFLVFDEETGRPSWDLKAIKKAGKFNLVKKLEILPDGGVKLEWHDPQAAVEKLSKHHGLFRERIEIGGISGTDAGATDRVLTIVQGISQLSRTIVFRETNSVNQPSLVCSNSEPLPVGASETPSLPEPENDGSGGREGQEDDCDHRAAHGESPGIGYADPNADRLDADRSNSGWR